MPLFKKSEKTRKPSQQLAFFGIPTHVTMVPLDFGADLGLGANPDRIANGLAAVVISKVQAVRVVTQKETPPTYRARTHFFDAFQ